MKIGLLLPRSTFYTSISFDIFNGVKAKLIADRNEQIEIYTENIGFGAEKQVVYRAAEQLIMQHDTDIIFAYISHSSAQLLRPLFASTNRVLIVLDPGANLPQEWPKSENIVYHSLNNALGAFCLGDLMKKDGIREAAFSTGYYDGGYLQTFALAKGLEKAGIQLNHNVATGYIREEFSMKDLKPYLDSNTNKALVAIFSGDFLQWFFQEMQAKFPDRKEPIYLPPFALEESMLLSAPYPGGTIKGIAAWSKNLTYDSNLEFIDTMKQKNYKLNLFSLLGWETGILINLLKQIHIPGEGKKTVSTLTGSSIETPRGKVEFDTETNTSYGSLYTANIVKNDQNNCELLISGALDTRHSYSEMIKLELENSVSGWQNSYVCN